MTTTHHFHSSGLRTHNYFILGTVKTYGMQHSSSLGSLLLYFMKILLEKFWICTNTVPLDSTTNFSTKCKNCNKIKYFLYKPQADYNYNIHRWWL